MLELSVGGDEYFDDENQMFIMDNTLDLEFEHSLATLTAWEMEFEKPFLSLEKKSDDETWAYIRHMCLNRELSDEDRKLFKQSDMDAIDQYITRKMSATWFREDKGPRSRAVITSELIYYWMVSHQIPFECQHWHLNRLFALIKVCNEKNAPQKKMSGKDAMAQQRALNQQRRAKYNTKG